MIKKRAEQLIDRLIQTSTYPDYAPKGGNGWELSALNTIRGVLKDYLPRNSQNIESYSAEIRSYVVYLAERLMPYLLPDSRKELFGLLCMVDPTKKYEAIYVNTLIDDVSHYAHIRRPRGWASAKVVNRISSEIIHAFEYLDEMGKIREIIIILQKLKDAGFGLEPINYPRWLEICKSKVSDKTFDYICSVLNIS